MLELVVLILFIAVGYSVALIRTLLLRRRDRKQHEAASLIASAAHGEPVEMLMQSLGDPFEIEQGTTGRELYIWKFPPSNTLPKGTGLFVLTVTTDHGIVTSFHCKRHRQL